MDGEEWRVDEFLDLLPQSATTGTAELDRVENMVREVMQPPEFDDDFSLLIVKFG